MKSRATPSFWRAYNALPDNVQREARTTHRLWRRAPFHSTLHFKQLAGLQREFFERVSTLGDVWGIPGTSVSYTHLTLPTILRV